MVNENKKTFENQDLIDDLIVALNNWYWDLYKMKYGTTKHGVEISYPTNMFNELLKKHNLTLTDLGIDKDYLKEG